MQRNFGAAAHQQQTPGTADRAILAIEIRKRSAERARIDVTEVGGAFDGGGQSSGRK